MTARARSIATGGLLLVLLSTTACDKWRERFHVDDTPGRIRAVTHKPLPQSGYRVRWDGHTVPAEMARGSSADARVVFTNMGDVIWPDIPAGDPEAHSGAFAVRLGYGWTAASAPPARANRRAELPHPVHPGETITLLIPLEAPDQPGEYRLTLNMVQELAWWFDDRGAPPLVVSVTVR